MQTPPDVLGVSVIEGSFSSVCSMTFPISSPQVCRDRHRKRGKPKYGRATGYPRGPHNAPGERAGDDTGRRQYASHKRKNAPRGFSGA